MRTSATGADRRGRAEAGFTLVELMVVVAVMGLMASVVVLSAPSGRSSLSTEAESFGARLKRAQEEAVLTNRDIGVEVTGQGYAFRARTRSGWAPLEEGPFAAHLWADGVTAVLDDGRSRGLVRFGATGLVEPADVILSRETRRVRVSVDAAGAVHIEPA